jgi:hypothetical protein
MCLHFNSIIQCCQLPVCKFGHKHQANHAHQSWALMLLMRCLCHFLTFEHFFLVLSLDSMLVSLPSPWQPCQKVNITSKCSMCHGFLNPFLNMHLKKHSFSIWCWPRPVICWSVACVALSVTGKTVLSRAVFSLLKGEIGDHLNGLEFFVVMWQGGYTGEKESWLSEMLLVHLMDCLN